MKDASVFGKVLWAVLVFVLLRLFVVVGWLVSVFVLFFFSFIETKFHYVVLVVLELAL